MVVLAGIKTCVEQKPVADRSQYRRGAAFVPAMYSAVEITSRYDAVAMMPSVVFGKRALHVHEERVSEMCYLICISTTEATSNQWSPIVFTTQVTPSGHGLLYWSVADDRVWWTSTNHCTLVVRTTAAFSRVSWSNPSLVRVVPSRYLHNSHRSSGDK